MSQPFEYDAFDLKPQRQRRKSTIAGKPTSLLPETEIQIAIVTSYRKRCRIDPLLRDGTLLWAVNGASGNIAPYLRDIQKRAGKLPGVFDLHLIDLRQGRPLYTWIEVKTATGRLSPEQEGLAKRLAGTGIRTAIARSVDEFWEVADG